MGPVVRDVVSCSIRALYLSTIACFLGLGASSGPGPNAKAERVAQSEREVDFTGANGVKLAGTLLIPAHEPDAKVPGVIIVAGSGPTDRNGNQPGLTINLLKQIAELLAQERIASLRYDKRWIGASEKPKDEQSWPAFTPWESFVGDAAAALSYLQDQPEIDANRTAMIGHSEGGMLVLQAAVEGKCFRKPPAALVLAATPGRRGDIVLRGQVARNFLMPVTKNDEIMATIKETGQVPDDVPPLLAALYPPYLGKFWQGVLNFEGAAWASRFPGPVLVLSGEKDAQHVVAQETSALAEGLKKRQPDDHEVYIVPGASHCLKPVKTILEPGFTGDMAPEAAAKLRSWLGRTLRTTTEN
jgi:uncharacterized protein